jgi:hypothetical protein
MKALLRRSLLVGLIGLFLGASGAHAASRDDVDAIAKLIGANYFDPVRANEIAKKLRQESRRGDFDRIKSPEDLADTLTTRLRPLDGHFNVVFKPTPLRDEEPPDSAGAFDDSERRMNYGFRKVDRLAGNVGYIELSVAADIDFDNAADRARATADSALGMMQDTDAVILDLRNNGGGSPGMVGYLVSAFVKPEAEVYNIFHSREGTESEKPPASYPHPMVNVPLFVLTSARTGSAAEAIAFTLQSCGRAQVIGERSAGAANPGDMFLTKSGFSIFIPTGSPRNPINQRNWEGTGVQPNVETTVDSALSKAHVLALQATLRGTLDAFARKDAQLTLEALRATDQPVTLEHLDQYAGGFGAYSIAVEAGALNLKGPGRNVTKLIAIRKDVFAPESDLPRRIQFEREGDRIVALEILTPTGERRRAQRSNGSRQLRNP